MFRIRDPQESLWQSQFLVTPKKAKRLERSWAEVFRNEALPLIDEERFAPMYCVDNGRPNRAVQTVLGVHLLKEMFNLTDDEALEQLEFNLLWHHALRLDIEETHLPYNAAQTSEKDTFVVLLADLRANIPQPEYGFGRPRFPLADMVYTGTTKVYAGFSARRFDCDVRDACRKDFISTPPSFNSVNRYIANPDLTPIITALIERSAEPLSIVESAFAVDSSGFSTCRFDRWYDAKWGKEKSQRQWLKAHIVTGTKTNIVTSVEITPSNIHDSPVLPGLLDSTDKQFTMTEVSADKAYLSDANLRLIEGHGAYPYIPFKSNTKGRGSPMWKRLYAYFTLNEESWAAHYHRRSNVETTFSMIKGKFGDSVRAKSKPGQVNEILLKVLCHNICVLIQSMHEFGVAPSLEPKVLPESQVRWLS